MAPVVSKKRSVEDEVRRPKKKIRKFKRQAEYHSSSEDDDVEDEQVAGRIEEVAERIEEPKEQHRSILKAAIREREPQKNDGEEVDDSDNDDEDVLDRNTAQNMLADESISEDEERSAKDDGVPLDGVLEEDEDEEGNSDIESDDITDTSSNPAFAKKKRNDPSAFATSMSKILTTKLSTQKRSDPILSRSKSASDANKSISDGKLEAKAKASMRAEKKSLLERGRVKDVLGLETPGLDTGAIMEQEKKLKKTAQRGVVKLFNAVRAAQVKAEEATRQAREDGTVGMRKREEKVNEMSKEGFLELISRGGKASVEA